MLIAAAVYLENPTHQLSIFQKGHSSASSPKNQTTRHFRAGLQFVASLRDWGISEQLPELPKLLNITEIENQRQNLTTDQH